MSLETQSNPERELPEGLSTLYAQLLKAHSEGSKENAAEYLKALREESGLSVRALCEDLRVSTSTFSRWIGASHLPTTEHLRTLKKVLLNIGQHVITTHSTAVFGNRKILLLSLEDLLKRYEHCKEIWGFKHLFPYRAGIAGDIRKKMTDLMVNRNAIFNFVFFGTESLFSENSDTLRGTSYPAQYSFARFKAYFNAQHPAHKTKLRGYQVTTKSLAWDMGLVNHHIGIVLNVYNQTSSKEVPELKDREIDIYAELPIAAYEDSWSAPVYREEVRLFEFAPKQSSLYKSRFERFRSTLEEPSNRHLMFDGWSEDQIQAYSKNEVPDDLEYVF